MKKCQQIFIIVVSVTLGYLLMINKEKIAMAASQQIQLPQALTKGKVSLEEAILKRRSQRDFNSSDLSLEQIAQLLWAAQGITEKKGSFSLRAAPSAGALYPMEIYLLTKDGFFHYLPDVHKLDILGKKDLRRSLAGAALGQNAISEAPVDIVICAVYSRVTSKYAERGIKYVHIEAGHIAQNIHLQAVALGLVSVPIGAFNDEEVKKIFSLPRDEEPLYIIPVGYPD